MDASLLTSVSRDQAQAAYADGLKSRAATNGAQSPTKVRETAQKFEAFFVGQMMEYMTAGLKADNIFGGGQAEETWRSMLNQEYGKEVAKSGKLGIADTVAKAMIQLQAKRTAAASDAAGAALSVAPTPIAGDAAEAALPVAAQAAVMAGRVARYAQTQAM